MSDLTDLAGLFIVRKPKTFLEAVFITRFCDNNIDA